MTFVSDIPATGTTELPDVLSFDVTEEDIELGAKTTPLECMIARSVRRMLLLKYGIKARVAAGYTSFNVIRPGKAGIQYAHPYAKFVQAWDAGLPTSPFTARADRLKI